MKSFSFRIKFLDHELKDGVTWYNISITDVNSQKSTWFLKTRYSLIRILHGEIKDNYQGALPDFPPKKIIGNLDPNFISQRKKHLENYFNTLLRTINVEKIIPLRDFLLQGRKIDDKSPTVEDTSKKTLKENQIISKERGGEIIKEKEPVQNSIIKAAGGSIEKVVDFFSNKMVNITSGCSFPEEEEIQKRKKLYEKMTILKPKIGIFDKYRLPKGNEMNLIAVKKESWLYSNSQMIKQMDECLRQIIIKQENIEEYVNVPTIIHDVL